MLFEGLKEGHKAYPGFAIILAVSHENTKLLGAVLCRGNLGGKPRVHRHTQ